MRKLLLLLPIILATPVLAESDPFGLGKSALKKYTQHLDNSIEFTKLEDYEMACSEMRMASLVLKIQFSEIQQYRPDINWFEARSEDQDFITKVCEPYGD